MSIPLSNPLPCQPQFTRVSISPCSKEELVTGLETSRVHSSRYLYLLLRQPREERSRRVGVPADLDKCKLQRHSLVRPADHNCNGDRARAFHAGDAVERDLAAAAAAAAALDGIVAV